MSSEPPINPFAAPTAVDEPMVSTATALGIDTRGLPLARNGLRCVYIALCGIFLSFLAMMALVAVQGGLPGVWHGGLLILAFLMLYLVGIGMCIGSPPASNSGGLAGLALGLFLGPMAVNFVLAAVEVRAETLGVSAPVGNVCVLGSFACFLLYMRRMAGFLGRPDVARRATRALVTGLIFFGVVIFANIADEATGIRTREDGAMIAMGIGGIGSLFAFFMYANTATYLRKAINEVLAGGDTTRAQSLPPV